MCCCSAIDRRIVTLEAEVFDKRCLNATREPAARKFDAYLACAIFEITVSAALGAGMGLLERGLAALRGGVMRLPKLDFVHLTIHFGRAESHVFSTF